MTRRKTQAAIFHNRHRWSGPYIGDAGHEVFKSNNEVGNDDYRPRWMHIPIPYIHETWWLLKIQVNNNNNWSFCHESPYLTVTATLKQYLHTTAKQFCGW